MPEQNLIYIDQEYVMKNSFLTKRKFLIGSSLKVTDVWRSKEENGSRVINDFDL